MRRALAALAVVLGGCQAASSGARPALKEVYVEVAALSSAVARKVTFPLGPDEETAVFSAAYRFDGVTARDELLRTLASDEAGNPVTLDDPDDPPALLLLPSEALAREQSGVYVGHAAFTGSPGPFTAVETLHHVRLFVVNREPEPVRVDLREVVLEDQAGSTIDPIGGADEHDELLEALELLPGESGLAHLFFRGAGVPERIVLRWTVERRPDVASPAGRPRAAACELVLARRYVCDGMLTPLEARVADGGAIPPPTRRRREPWREPRLDAVMGAGQ